MNDELRRAVVESTIRMLTKEIEMQKAALRKARSLSKAYEKQAQSIDQQIIEARKKLVLERKKLK